jgi:hypothetical protein
MVSGVAICPGEGKLTISMMFTALQWSGLFRSGTSLNWRGCRGSGNLLSGPLLITRVGNALGGAKYWLWLRQVTQQWPFGSCPGGGGSVSVVMNFSKKP